MDSCLAQTKSHSHINSLALTVAMRRHWSREPITTLSGPSISMFRVIRTDYHAQLIFIPHRRSEVMTRTPFTASAIVDANSDFRTKTMKTCYREPSVSGCHVAKYVKSFYSCFFFSFISKFFENVSLDASRHTCV